MTTLKLSQPRPPKTSATTDGVTKYTAKPKTPRRYDFKTAPDGLRPKNQEDVEKLALDLLDREQGYICLTRNDLHDSIWLYTIGGCAARGRKVPDWNDLRPPLDGSWHYSNLGKAIVYEDNPIDDVSSPDLHVFDKPPPTGLPVFISPGGKDLGGYVKFYILPTGSGRLYLVSFHEYRRKKQPKIGNGRI